EIYAIFIPLFVFLLNKQDNRLITEAGAVSYNKKFNRLNLGGKKTSTQQEVNLLKKIYECFFISFCANISLKRRSFQRQNLTFFLFFNTCN
ncbi:hypothetical protein X975_14918, partial [Stegodyphus mimosarum]